MSNDSGIIGKQRQVPRIPNNSILSTQSRDIWSTFDTNYFGNSNCQSTSVSCEPTITWTLENKQFKEINHCSSEIESMIVTSGRNWNGYHSANGKHKDLPKPPKIRDPSKSHPKTVEDIERWLKIRADPCPTMDQSKSDVETVDRYLNTDLSSNFLEKDADVLSIEKLTLGYDPSYEFHELQSEKFLEVCGKDAFILPEFQLDNLDPLTLANNDMMVAGEILPSTSTHPEDFAPPKSLNPLNPLNPPQSPLKPPKIPEFDLLTLSNPEKVEFSSSSLDQGSSEAQTRLNGPPGLIQASSEAQPRLNGPPRLIQGSSEAQTRLNGSPRLIQTSSEPQTRLNGPPGLIQASSEAQTRLNGPQRLIQASSEAQTGLNGPSGLIQTSSEAQTRLNGPPRLIQASSEAQTRLNGPPGLIQTSSEAQTSLAGPPRLIQTSSEAPPSLAQASRSKLKTRIVKKKRKPPKFDEKMQYEEGEYQTDSKDGIMAVVAISTDKVSNMTQIVINTGKEEQIYQGKTSELMEATGYFPKLPKIETWRSLEKEAAPSNHEVIITNALQELGYTETGLVAMSLTLSANGKTWICPMEDCRREFNRLCALKGHLLAHYGVRPFKCDQVGCTWAFHSEFKLKRHKETHLKRKDYVCQVPNCNRRFTTIYNLWTHEKLHSRPSRIACHVPNCAERFQTKRALEIHMKSHDQEHAPYVCQQEGCGKRYYSSNALTSHQRCHSYKEVDIKCGWIGCGKIFDKPCRLKAHVRSHTGAKPYSCTYPGCEWAFSSSSKLKRHEKKHTNERKFLCDFPGCSKAFMRSEHLKEHRLTHKEGRYFQCYMCDARFSAKSSLYVHIKKHQKREENEGPPPLLAKISPLSIDKCRLEDSESVKILCNELAIEEAGKNNLNSNLNLNLNLNARETAENRGMLKYKFVCSFAGCGKIYASKSSLRGHMTRVHGDDDGFPAEKREKSEENDLNYVFYGNEGDGGVGGVVGVGEGEGEVPMAVEADEEINEGLPEPEPPPLIKIRKSHGAARTGLTYLDVWKLKKKINTTLNSVGPSDVVLGSADIEDGLMLSEELPSIYYQDELGTECQILMLESAANESTINLRDLE